MYFLKCHLSMYLENTEDVVVKHGRTSHCIDYTQNVYTYSVAGFFKKVFFNH